MIANKHYKKAFEGDCLRKLCEASAFIKISVNAKISKDQQKINFLQLWGHLKTLKFLINFCTILKVLWRSNFLLLLCSKRKTKIFFTPPYWANCQFQKKQKQVKPIKVVNCSINAVIKLQCTYNDAIRTLFAHCMQPKYRALSTNNLRRY